MKQYKEDCYLETLSESLTNVEMILNHLSQINNQSEAIPLHIIERDRTKTILHLELALASYCVLLRKMHENSLLDYGEEIHTDLNSIIHSNRFEYSDRRLVVYSKRGKENINLAKLLDFGHFVIDQYQKSKESA